MRKLLFFLLLTSSVFVTHAITIMGISVTESRCANSGTATVLLNPGGVAPFMYDIYTYPSGYTDAPAQGSNFFDALSPGFYSVRVWDAANDTTVSSFVIHGSYTPSNPTATFTLPSCPSASDGSITITPNGGRAPYLYRIADPITTPLQASPTFTGLPADTYIYETIDSCGNLQTRNITIPNPTDNFDIYFDHYIRNSCDSIDIIFRINNTGNTGIFPMSVTYITPQGDTIYSTSPAPNWGSYGYLDTVRFAYSRLASEDTIIAQFTSVCGTIRSIMLSPNFFIPNVYEVPGTSCTAACISAYIINNYILYPQSGGVLPTQYFTDSVSYFLKHNPTNTIIDSQTNLGFGCNFCSGIAGDSYTIYRYDPCGIIDSIVFTWPTLTPPSTYVFTKHGTGCKINMTNVWVAQNNFIGWRTVVLTSGPDSTVRYDGSIIYHNYPDTIYYQAHPSYIWFNDLGVGNYTYYIMDSCGNIVNHSFTIAPQDVLTISVEYDILKTCDGASIVRKVTNWGMLDYYGQLANLVTQPVIPGSTKNNVGLGFGDLYTDTIVNVSDGVYIMSVVPHGAVYNYPVCDIIYDTLVVQGYSPLLVSTEKRSYCNGTVGICLFAEFGKPPYLYRVNSGPTGPTMYLPNNCFTGLHQGLYEFSVLDSCNNSKEYSVYIDTLTIALPQLFGTPCIDSTYQISFSPPERDGLTYSWVLPNNNTFTGDTLILSPVDSTHFGTYVVKMVIDGGGCLDSSTIVFDLNPCNISLGVEKLDFSLLGTKCATNLYFTTYNEQNVLEFVVQKSDDNIHYQDIAHISPVSNGQNTATSYSYKDNSTISTITYFRILIKDMDGKERASKTISISNNCNSISESVQITPNPFQSAFDISFLSDIADLDYEIVLNDITGRTNYHYQFTTKSGMNKINISSEGLASGIYFLSLIDETGDRIYKAKLIKNTNH